MKKTGMDISSADAAKLAQQARAALLERLHKGGEFMPPFPQLSEADIRSLMAYLKQLADMPGARSEQSAVKESRVRVGELIVKSTCHTCHSAIGPNPGPQALLDGAIPPLSTLTRRKSQPEFVRKVTQGAPVLMGTPATLYRGRMPVFYYLSEDEAADVYLYLTLYPPSEQEKNASTPRLATVQVTPPPPPSPTPSGRNLPSAPSGNAPVNGNLTRTTKLSAIPLALTVVLAASLLVGGLLLTLREFKRLSTKAEAGNPVAGKEQFGTAPGIRDGNPTVLLSAPQQQRETVAVSLQEQTRREH
jgi:mono/diheme cytochrome c family protein